MERQLALKLACISETDRNWILSQLSSSEKATLKPLLDEIELLGLNKDPSVVNSVLDSLKNKDEKIQSSALDKVTNLDGIDPFWQAILLGSLDKKERNIVKRKFRLAMDDTQVIESAPIELKKTLIKLLSEESRVN